MKQKILIAVLIIFAVFLTACTVPQSQTTKTQQNFEETSFEDSSYQRITQELYQEVLDSDEVVILNFYADWCPNCAQERPAVNQAFTQETAINGFEVSYRSSDTTSFEEDLAREFGITSQGTKIILRPNQEPEKIVGHWSLEQWNAKIQEIGQ